jgi:hypothetical protein
MTIRTSTLRMVAESFPALFYGYPRTYIVAAVHADGRMDLDPPPDAQHLMPLKNAEQWSVLTMVPALGSEVVVWFRDANPGRYIVMGAKGGAGAEELEPGFGEGAIGAPPPYAPVAAAARRPVLWGEFAIMPVGTTGNGAVVQLVPAPPTGFTLSRARG